MAISKKRVLKQISLNAGEPFVRVNLGVLYTDSIDGSIDERGIDVVANSNAVKAAAIQLRNAVLAELAAELPQ